MKVTIQLIQYSSTRLIPKVAIDYRVVQNKRTRGSSFKFAGDLRFEMNENDAIKSGSKQKLYKFNDLTKHRYSSDKILMATIC